MLVSVVTSAANAAVRARNWFGSRIALPSTQIAASIREKGSSANGSVTRTKHHLITCCSGRGKGGDRAQHVCQSLPGGTPSPIYSTTRTTHATTR